MSENRLIGETVARAAEGAISLLIADQKIPSINTRVDAMAAIDKIVTQDPKMKSLRVWAAIAAIATAVLAVPEVQTYLGPWAPVLTSVLTAALAVWSKEADLRPVR